MHTHIQLQSTTVDVYVNEHLPS